MGGRSGRGELRRPSRIAPAGAPHGRHSRLRRGRQHRPGTGCRCPTRSAGWPCRCSSSSTVATTAPRRSCGTGALTPASRRSTGVRVPPCGSGTGWRSTAEPATSPPSTPTGSTTRASWRAWCSLWSMTRPTSSPDRAVSVRRTWATGCEPQAWLLFAALITVLTGRRITDPAFGLRAMKAEVPVALTLEQSQYQAAELLVAAILAGYRVAERPGVMRRRRLGHDQEGKQPELRLPLRPGRAGDLVAGPVTFRARPSLRTLGRPGPLAVTVLVMLPVLTFSVPALAGHPFVSTDNLIQNFPLRVLVARNLQHGHLPLWNPYIWSGTALLGGLNAGALYPGTLLFTVLPAEAAFVVNEIAVYVVGAIGLYVFLRRSSLSVGAAFLGSLSFTVGGFMSAQMGHIDLVQGASLVPWMLVALQRMAVHRTASPPGAAKPPARWPTVLLGAVRRPPRADGVARGAHRRLHPRGHLRRVADLASPQRPDPRPDGDGGSGGRGPDRHPVAARPGVRGPLPALGELVRLLHLWVVLAQAHGPDDDAVPVGELRALRGAAVPRPVQPGRGHLLRRHPPCLRRLRHAHPAVEGAASVGGTGRLVRHHRRRPDPVLRGVHASRPSPRPHSHLRPAAAPEPQPADRSTWAWRSCSPTGSTVCVGGPGATPAPPTPARRNGPRRCSPWPARSAWSARS